MQLPGVPETARANLPSKRVGESRRKMMMQLAYLADIAEFVLYRFLHRRRQRRTKSL